MSGQLNIRDEALAQDLRQLAKQHGMSIMATPRVLVNEARQCLEDERAQRLAVMLEG